MQVSGTFFKNTMDLLLLLSCHWRKNCIVGGDLGETLFCEHSTGVGLFGRFLESL
jgi:hypothetical protein